MRRYIYISIVKVVKVVYLAMKPEFQDRIDEKEPPFSKPLIH